MASGSSDDYKTVLQKFFEQLDKLQDSLNDDEPTDIDYSSFNKEEFWNVFVSTIKLVSHEVTKFGMLFDSTDAPEKEPCQSLSHSLECSMTKLVSLYHTFPKSKGRTLQEELNNYLTFLILNTKELCLAAKNAENTRVQLVACIWRKCDAVVKLSSDNKDAVVSICKTEFSIINDATEELIDAIENENEGLVDDTMFQAFLQNGVRIPCINKWTIADRRVICPCLALIKAYRACLKKTSAAISARGNGNEERPIAELDAIYDIAKDSNYLVDDFILALYPPTEHNVVREHACSLREKAKSLLNAVQDAHFCSEADKSWISFLNEAVDHNFTQVSDLVLAD